MSERRAFHVLTKKGDAQREVERIVASLGGNDNAGLHRYYYVSRANQSVVMTERPNSRLAEVLRSSGGWAEPGTDRVDG
jgi:hypothetical protein